MYWIALKPSREDERTAWGWRALQFTPRVAWAEGDVLVAEVSASQRLWGGRRALLARLFEENPAVERASAAGGATSLIAIGRLRRALEGEPVPKAFGELPLHVLAAARPHAPTLERVGCRTWDQLRALPRAGVARRFGDALVSALDRAYGEQPESYDWIQLPEDFDLKVELPALATSATELMWTAQRLMSQLQLWLQGRNRGIVALELEWTLDLRRLDGKQLPPHERIEVRTSQPTQDMAHLRKLVGEHLARTTIGAPANALRLRSVETLPWGGLTPSLLPEDKRTGERLHELVERLSVRLGEHNVRVPRTQEDHRPERMQQWVPARGASAKPAPVKSPDAVYPTWLLPTPVPLKVKDNRPQYGGPLRRLTRLYRVETAWWEPGGPALRDYFIARSEAAGLVWVFRERPLHANEPRWFLQGLYA